MAVSFANLRVGSTYSRNDLARLWRYKGMEALARGVVTPRADNKIILFVTREKQTGYEPYEDGLVGDTLYWEGPTDHFAEERMLRANESGEEIHLFYRERHHRDFTYCGQLRVVKCDRRSGKPSKFVFDVV